MNPTEIVKHTDSSQTDKLYFPSVAWKHEYDHIFHYIVNLGSFFPLSHKLPI